MPRKKTTMPEVSQDSSVAILEPPASPVRMRLRLTLAYLQEYIQATAKNPMQALMFQQLMKGAEGGLNRIKEPQLIQLTSSLSKMLTDAADLDLTDEQFVDNVSVAFAAAASPADPH